MFLAIASLLGSGISQASPTFANAVTNGTVTIAGLTEASGVQASRNNLNVLWTHNDSGHPAQVFAIDTQGQLLGTYSLPANSDNEDIAMGPGPITNIIYLYVGDIGDNASTRANIRIYQMPEPAVYDWQNTNPVTAGIKGQRTITLTYPDGAHNAEAMFVDPIAGDLFILTKAATSRIYTAPKSQLDTNDSFALTFVRTLAFDVPSAADISPSGSEILVRQEDFAKLWTRSPGQSINDAFSGTPVAIPVQGSTNGEPNGEAIGFDAIGSGYFTMSDSATTQPLRYFARTSNDGPAPAPRILIGAGDTWRFLDNGSDQGTAWRNPAFNDSAWNSGVAQFGYGEGDEQTLVSYGANPNSKHITTYFRKSFLANNTADFTNVVLKMAFSHGASVYLNGNLVANENLAPSAAYNTLATNMPVNLQSTWHIFNLAPQYLLEGTNTLAVEVHQCSLNSSNLSFDLQLLGAHRNTAYEPFDYAAGTSLVNVTNPGAQWWTSAGPAGSAAIVVASNLPVAGLAPCYGGAMQFGAVQGPSARFNLPVNVTNSTLYYSCAIKVLDLGNLTMAGGWIGGFNNTRGSQANTPTVIGTRILLRTTGTGGFNVGVAKNSTNATDWVWSSAVLSTNETVFLVGSYTFNSSSSTDDISKLWINPNLLDFGASAAPLVTLAATTGPDMNANQIASCVFLQQGNGSTNQPKTVLVDELRIGYSWAAVTPQANPTLSVSYISGKVVLYWPTNAAGYQLQVAADLSGTDSWTNVPNSPAVSGKLLKLTNSPAGAAFFRLRK